MRRSKAYASGALLLVVAASASLGAQSATPTPDQQLLQELANINRGVELVAHKTLHRTGAFPSKADAQAVDKQHDDEMDHIRAALAMLNDTYSPHASHADSAAAAALGKLTGASYDSAFRADVVHLDQREVQAADKYLPQLTNPQIKTMAQRVRAAAQSEATKLGG
jgi:Domain of unknown function (DUF4142)